MVDVSKLNSNNKTKKEKYFGKVFLFTFLGALVGTLPYFGIHLLTHTVAGFLYLMCGMGAYAFYLYFVNEEERNKIDDLIMCGSCLLAVVISYFFDVMIHYAPQYIDDSMNIFSKTFKFYSINIETLGFKNSTDSHSILFIQTMFFVLSVIGLFLSKLFIHFSSKSHEKKHGKDNDPNGYGYRSKKKKSKKR